MQHMAAKAILACLLAVPLAAQTPPAKPDSQQAKPEFEVASIKPAAPPDVTKSYGGTHQDGAQVSFNFLSLNDYIGAAYGVRNYQISGPDWMASQRFDIVAKLPAGAQRKDIPAMMQALLADRFQMQFHRENRDLPVYGLVVAKSGLKMQESPPDAAGAKTGVIEIAAAPTPGGVTVNYGNGAYFTFANNRFEGKKMPAAAMADVMARFSDRPVMDMTNLKGRYDFLIELSPEDFRAMGIRSAIAAGVALPPQALQYAESASGDSLANAMEKLGLKLEPRKAPVEVLVIDHMSKTPTEN